MAQITNGQDHVIHHVILFDVDVWMLLSMVLSIAKIQISLVLNASSHVLEVTVLKDLNLEHVLSGKSPKYPISDSIAPPTQRVGDQKFYHRANL